MTKIRTYDGIASVRHEGTVRGRSRQEAAKSIADCGLRIADLTTGGRGADFSLSSLFSPADSSYSGFLPAMLSSAGPAKGSAMGMAAKRRIRFRQGLRLHRAWFAKDGARHSSHLSHSSYLRMAGGGPPSEFCAFLRLFFSNLYQISRDFHGLQPGFTAHFARFGGKSAQVPSYEQLTTFFWSCQSNRVKVRQSKSR